MPRIDLPASLRLSRLTLAAFGSAALLAGLPAAAAPQTPAPSDAEPSEAIRMPVYIEPGVGNGGADENGIIDNLKGAIGHSRGLSLADDSDSAVAHVFLFAYKVPQLQKDYTAYAVVVTVHTSAGELFKQFTGGTLADAHLEDIDKDALKILRETRHELIKLGKLPAASDG